MGLADFLAEAGRNTAIGQIAQASGGRTVRQRGFDSFVNQELPALMQEIEANTDGSEKTLRALGDKFVQSAARAGIPVQGIEKLMGMTVGPALKDLRLNAIRSELQPQPRPAGTEGPLTEKGNFRDPKEFDADMAIRAFQATGADPQHFGQFIRAPAQIESSRAQAGQRTASQKLTEGKIAEQQKIDQAIEALPDEAPEGQISQRAMARLNRGGLSQYVPQREMSQGAQQLAEERLRIAEDRARQAGDLGAQRIDLARERLDLSRQGQEQRQQDSETVADQPYSSLDREVDLAAIAKDALKEGVTTPDGIRAIAARRGLVIEGDPKLVDDRWTIGQKLGTTGKPSLSGEFTIQRKPKVTTRTKPASGAAPAGPAKSSNNDPLGIRKR